jgi:hypothetical protein
MEADLLPVNLAGLYRRLGHHKGAGQLDLSSFRITGLRLSRYPDSIDTRNGRVLFPAPLENRRTNLQECIAML